jgi:hypothetical protein
VEATLAAREPALATLEAGFATLEAARSSAVAVVLRRARPAALAALE